MWHDASTLTLCCNGVSIRKRAPSTIRMKRGQSIPDQNPILACSRWLLELYLSYKTSIPSFRVISVCSLVFFLPLVTRTTVRTHSYISPVETCRVRFDLYYGTRWRNWYSKNFLRGEEGKCITTRTCPPKTAKPQIHVFPVFQPLYFRSTKIKKFWGK